MHHQTLGPASLSLGLGPSHCCVFHCLRQTQAHQTGRRRSWGNPLTSRGMLSFPSRRLRPEPSPAMVAVHVRGINKALVLTPSCLDVLPAVIPNTSYAVRHTSYVIRCHTLFRHPHTSSYVGFRFYTWHSQHSLSDGLRLSAQSSITSSSSHPM